MRLTSYLTTALAGAATASSVQLSDAEVVAVIIRTVTTIQQQALPGQLLKRDTSACVTAVSNFGTNVDVDSLPTQPPKLQSDISSYLSAHPSETDICTLNFTGILSAEASSYTSSVSSWVSEHIIAIRSVYSACSDLPIISETLAQIAGPCSIDLDQITGTGVPAAASTSSSSDSGADAVGASSAVVALVAGFVALLM